MKTISKQMCKGRNDLLFTEVLESSIERLRIRISRNDYDFQSFAIIERHDGSRWHEVHTLLPESSKTVPWFVLPGSELVKEAS